MRNKPLEKIEAGRIQVPDLDLISNAGDLFGCFTVVSSSGGLLRVISSGVDSEYGWEHVSVSLAYRTPFWSEMCMIKDQFWYENETVMQFHPAKENYVNCHQFCLHLWRPVHGRVELPPSFLVGPKQNEVKWSPPDVR